MQLNKLNGHIVINDLVIAPEFSIAEIENLSGKYVITKRVEGKNYTTYSIANIDNGEIALSFTFLREKLSFLSISAGKKYGFPPFIITDEERKFLSNKLKLIGDENIYSWGSIAINEDIKGGVLSILIKYQ